MCEETGETSGGVGFEVATGLYGREKAKCASHGACVPMAGIESVVVGRLRDGDDDVLELEVLAR